MILHTKNRDFTHKLMFVRNIFPHLSVILPSKRNENAIDNKNENMIGHKPPFMLKSHHYSIILLFATIALLIFSCKNSRIKQVSGNDSINWTDSTYTLFQKVLTLYANNQADSLEHLADEAMALCEEHQQWRYYYLIWESKAETYIWNNRFDKAAEEAKRMQDDSKRRNNDYGDFISHRLLGTGYLYLNKYEDAEKYLRLAITKYPVDGKTGGLVKIYSNLGQALAAQNHYEALDSVLTEWDAIISKYPVKRGAKKADVYANWHEQYQVRLTEYHIGVKDYQAATLALDSAEYYEEIDGNYIDNLSDICKLRCELSRLQGNFLEAFKRSNQLKEMAQKLKNVQYMTIALKERADALEGLKWYEEALKARHELEEYKDSLAQTDLHNDLGNLSKWLDVNELQTQNELLQQRSRFTTGGIAMILGIGAILVFLMLNSRWNRTLEVKNFQLQRERNVVVAQNKQLEIERDHAEAASRAKTSFMQSMTHEIRTPLNSINGFTQVLTIPGIDLPEAERVDLCQRIQENTRLLTNVLDDLILISDMESRTELPAPEPCLLSALAMQAADAIRPIVDSKVTLECSSNLQDEQMVTTHYNLIHTALVKLLDNAAKFTKEGHISLTVNEEDRHLHFSVTDSGPGIPQDKAEEIFERFVKLDSFTQGTGLGLTIARMIAERLGGTLTLDTSYTGGAKFDFIIPTA